MNDIDKAVEIIELLLDVFTTKDVSGRLYSKPTNQFARGKLDRVQELLK